MSFTLNGIYSYVKEAFSLENSSKIGDLSLSFRKRSAIRQTEVVAAPVLNHPALPVSSNQTLSVIVNPLKIFNFRRFAARIVRKDSHGGAQLIHAFVEGPSREMLIQRASCFLSRLQQGYLPNGIKAPLFAVSQLISGNQLTYSVKHPKLQKVDMPDLDIDEISSFKSLYKRARRGDFVASFKLFQVYWTDRMDQKNNYSTAIQYLSLSRHQGSRAAVEAEKLVYKCRRSNMLDSRKLRNIITNMDPYADGFRLVGTTLGRTVNFGSEFLNTPPVSGVPREQPPVTCLPKPAPQVEYRHLTVEQLLENSQKNDPEACFQLYIHFKMYKNTLVFKNDFLMNIVNRFPHVNLRNSKEIAWLFLNKAAELKYEKAVVIVSGSGRR